MLQMELHSDEAGRFLFLYTLLHQLLNCNIFGSIERIDTNCVIMYDKQSVFLSIYFRVEILFEYGHFVDVALMLLLFWCSILI